MTDKFDYVAVKTRFCPSPTGFIHLGNVRTALFNALLAKHHQGVFLLRIEDTDVERSEARYTQQLQEDLLWLGLDWQEGPEHDKGLGPYHQSARQAIYDDYYQRLESMGSAYPCFCSEEELALSRKIQRSQGRPPRYAGTCRDLPREEVDRRIAAGEKPTLRFRVPLDEEVSFDDLVRGKQTFKSNDIGDFIIRRANGTSPFMFCNAVDDALMEVTFALRGEDHLTNTPRQIMILEELGLTPPTYGHIALIVGKDGSPLSKRHGSRSIIELREEGFLPSAVVNYLARLGHYYGHDTFVDLSQLAAEFNTDALAKAPAKFNLEQLHFWQKQAVAALSDDALWAWMGEAVQQIVPEAERHTFLELVKPNVIFPVDALHWARIIFSDELTFGDQEAAILKTAGVDYFKVAVAAYEQFGSDLPAITQHLKSTLNVKGKALYQPLRVALTSECHGPELAKLIQMMKPHEVKRRLEMAV